MLFGSSPKDAVRAIRRRLSTAGKNYTSVMYTLTVSYSFTVFTLVHDAYIIIVKDYMQRLFWVSYLSWSNFEFMLIIS